uniref:Uncharacterized protein n=1 Tax=Avena sativa TaxID=4498 RepID=A0ACD6A752_AVESA
MEAVAAGAIGDGMEIVVFPWLAFGHMLPFLELSKRVAARGHTVSFVSTPRNLARLPPVPPHLSARIRFVSLPLPRVDGLSEGAESTADVPPGKDELLKKAMDGLAAPFTAFLADAAAGGRRPDWIVNDFCHHWLPSIAAEHKVPCALFQIVLAGMVAYMGPRWANNKSPRMALEDFAVPPEWFSVSSTIVYNPHEAGWLAGCFQPNASGVSDIERLWQINEQCHVAIYRSCEEIEPGMFALLANLFQKPSIPVGTLPPSHELVDDGEIIRSDILQWLDGQPPKSVIYVALGSEAPLSAEILQELALGLELAGVRFMWALRRPDNTNTDVDGHNVLPNGFEERTRHCGLVSTRWVPQVKVLGHGAVGAFLTHCGWGSTLESFMFGLPLVMLPFVVDQPLVARTMVERGIGIEVAREEGAGSFGRDGVAAAVRRVMAEEEGKVFASKAEKLREALADLGRQERYIDDLVDNLRRYKDATYN